MTPCTSPTAQSATISAPNVVVRILRKAVHMLSGEDVSPDSPTAARRRNSVRSWAGVVVQSTAVSFIILIGVTAILSGAGHVKLPYELFVLDQHLPVVFRIHMAASGLALVLITIALLVRHRSALHRPIGRIAIAAVVLGGLTSLPSALMSEATAIARAGFFAQGCVWLGLLGAGIVAIRAGHDMRHRQMMVAMTAVASGAVWLRFATMATAAFELPFELVYAFAAWASWLIPLTATWKTVGGKEHMRPSLTPCTGNDISPRQP